MSSSKNSKPLILVQHRKTGEVELRRAGHFSRGPGWPSSPSASAPRHLHFADSKSSHVCRCPNSKRHKFSSPVASSSTHLAQDLTQYLDENVLDECSVAAFRKYRQRERDQWAHEGIFVNNFHYATKQKDVVCRCTKPNNHGHEVVRNADIQEFCVRFFRGHPSKMTCTKDQWRKAAKMAEVDQLLKDASLQAEQHTSEPRPYLGAQNMVDIPQKVWENGRPSVWNVDRGIGSSNSTPLGSPVAHRSPKATYSEGIRQHTTPNIPRRDSALTVWSTIQRQVAAGTPESLEEDFEHLSVADGSHRPSTSVADQVTARRSQGQAMTQAQVSSPGSGPSSAHVKPLNFSPYGDSLSANQLKVSSQSLDVPVLLSELSAHDTLADLPLQGTCPELPDQLQSPKAQLSPEFRDLEGTRRDSSLVDASEYLQHSKNKACSSDSETTQNSGKLASLFCQVTDALDLPNQEDFLLRHVTVFSRAQPAPLNDCVLCAEPLIHRQKRTLQLHCCGQFLHEACLVAQFRFRDEALGRCSICSMAVCKRDLADRLDTDRKAIFGTGFTEVHDTFRLSFPHRDEAAHLKSEEELATAQLRLLKDLIQVHADEILSKWDFGRSEPEWYVDVIHPSVKLWKGWNSSYSPSRYFTDRDAFLNLLAWAELVRLANCARPAPQQLSEEAVQPPLPDLHKKFQWAKGRYERERKTWKVNSSGVLACEIVAQDVYDMAMSALHSSPP